MIMLFRIIMFGISFVISFIGSFIYFSKRSLKRWKLMEDYERIMELHKYDEN